jgi:phosphoribosylglycinamide formyltransferase-1
MKRIAILASGKGSNAQALISHFSGHSEMEVAFVGSNRRTAGVLEIAKESGIESQHFSKDDLQSGALLEKLILEKIDYVLLSGFLLKIPSGLINHFENRILNIHPSLLPLYGGKGMYGLNVHRAVLEAGDSESGMTIHKVTENYDEGAVVFQCSVDITDAKSPEEIATKVLALEHEYYPRIAEAMIKES